MAGRRASAGEAISTAFIGSAVNQVISKRMVKKQQMRWTPRGAHLLLQVRTRVLNNQWPGPRQRAGTLALAAGPLDADGARDVTVTAAAAASSMPPRTGGGGPGNGRL